MKGYLLDTNAISDWLDSTRPRHDAVSERIDQCARAKAVLLTSTVVLGEIEYGIRVSPKGKAQFLDQLLAQVDAQFVNRRLLLEVSRSTTAVYGEVRGRLFERYATRDKRRKGLRPEELVCPVTSKVLGIQENDLWIAAQAIDRNLVLVSSDRMQRIQDVAPELKVEDWGLREA